jgi:hypothetical protein
MSEPSSERSWTWLAMVKTNREQATWSGYGQRAVTGGQATHSFSWRTTSAGS